MRILHTVEFYHPSQGGAQEVVRQISERLAARGHEVTVATSRLRERKTSELNGVHIREFDVRGNWSRGISGEVDAYRNLAMQGRFDVIMNYAAQQWTTDALLDRLPQIAAKKVLVPCGFSGLFEDSYKDYFRRMGSWMRSYDACVYLSDHYRDVEFARSHGLENGHLIPNGAGEDEFGGQGSLDIRAKLGIGPDSFLVLTVGSHTDQKGHREAVRMFRKADFGRSAVLLIVGNSFGGGCTWACRRSDLWSRISPRWRMHRRRVISARLTRAETLAAYGASDLFLFPSNVECSPLVLFEACAAGLPYLTGPAGNAEEIIEWTGGGALIAGATDARGITHCDVNDGARLLGLLARDAAEREALGARGRRAWRERFTWEKIALKYEELYASLLGVRP